MTVVNAVPLCPFLSHFLQKESRTSNRVQKEKANGQQSEKNENGIRKEDYYVSHGEKESGF